MKEDAILFRGDKNADFENVIEENVIIIEEMKKQGEAFMTFVKVSKGILYLRNVGVEGLFKTSNDVTGLFKNKSIASRGYKLV